MEYGELTFGEVVRGTVSAMSDNWAPLLAYVAIFTGIGSAGELVDLAWFDSVLGETDTLATVQSFAGLGFGLAGLLLFVLTLIGQYLLWEAVLRNSGFASGLGRHRYLAFIGQSFLIVLCTSFGFILLLIPGLIFGARWQIAPALVVRSDLGVVESMRRSWNAISGNTTPVVLASLAGGFIILLAGVTIGGTSALTGEVPGANPITAVAGQLVGQFQAVLAISMGLFLYRKLYDHSGELAEVFV